MTPSVEDGSKTDLSGQLVKLADFPEVYWLAAAGIQSP
jgi:hypothetical protein